MGWAQDLPEWSALGIESDVMSVLPSRSPKRSVLCAPMAATGVIASARIALGAGHATPHPWGQGSCKVVRQAIDLLGCGCRKVDPMPAPGRRVKRPTAKSL